MRIAIFHISDIHIENAEDTKVVNVKKISDALKSVVSGNIDCVWFIVSGDIANKGKQEQYSAAYKMFGSILSDIKRTYNLAKIEFLCVPGNHDVDLSNDEGHQALQSEVRSGVTPDILTKELRKQKNYENYANGVYCLDKSDKLCNIKEFSMGKKILKVCLLNTAIFSTLDEDKGLHFLPETVMSKMEHDLNGDVNIVVMHHAHHWMNERMKNRFENVLFHHCDVVLCGHEHDIQSRSIEKAGNRLIYLTGGELSNQGDWRKSEFYIDVIDTDEMVISSNQFIWNAQREIYQKKNEKPYSLTNKNGHTSLELEQDFLLELKNDSVNSLTDNVFDYYVFPDIELVDDNSRTERKVFADLESFIELICEKKYLSIIGTENSGKSLLLKKLFLELNERGYTCVMCNMAQMNNTSIRKIIRNMFRNNYKDEAGSFDEFLQMPKMKKVVLLDNMDDIQKEQMLTLLKLMHENFGIVIYVTRDVIELDLAERVKMNAELTDYDQYKILPMYLKKRQVLISNIVDIRENDSEDKAALTEKIAAAIKQQRKMYAMNPSFIIQFTDFYLKNFKDSFATDGNIFSKVFESNMVNRIRPIVKKMTVDKIMILLDEVSYFCFKGHLNDVSQEDICRIISNYNDIHGDEVEVLQFISVCKESKILKDSSRGGYYRFVDKNVLAYFIARQIIRIWNDELDDTDMKYLLRYVTYGINSTIILFVTYLTDNLYLIRSIIDCTISYMQDWIAFNPEKVNVPYLASINGQIPMEAPSQKDREKNSSKEQENDKAEIEKYEDSQIVAKDYFETDMDDSEELMNQILRSVTLLDITSKCLPGFEHRMKREDKEKVIRLIFQLPSRIFYKWACEVDGVKDEMVQFLLEEFRAVYLDPRDWGKVTKDDMMIYLQRESLALLLDLLNISIGNAAKDYTIKYLEGYSDKEDKLYQIQMLMAYGKLDDVSKFERHLDQTKKSLDKCLLDYMRRRVVKHYLVTSKKITNDKVQSLIGKYFPTKRNNQMVRNILISRERNSKKQ